MGKYLQPYTTNGRYSAAETMTNVVADDKVEVGQIEQIVCLWVAASIRL
jgi:hypothetical protein